MKGRLDKLTVSVCYC